MSRFLEYAQHLYESYSNFLFTRDEVLTFLYQYVEANPDDLEYYLPRKMVRIAQKHSLGFTRETFDSRRWFRFLECYFKDPDCFWEKFEAETDKVFRIRYEKYQ
jgi:hypothetical protein